MPKPAAFAEALLPFDEAGIPAAALGVGARLPSYIADHRKRLRERFMVGGAAALPEPGSVPAALAAPAGGTALAVAGGAAPNVASQIDLDANSPLRKELRHKN